MPHSVASLTSRTRFVQHAGETVQTTREDAKDQAPATRPEPLAVRIYEIVVILPVVAVSIYGVVQHPEAFGNDLIAWIVLIAAVDLLPVPVWRGVELLLDFPLLIAVAMLYAPATACFALFVGSFDIWEFRGKVSPLRAGFNRAQAGATALAASATFHALGSVSDDLGRLVLAAGLAMIAGYLVSAVLVATGISLFYRESIASVLRRMRIGDPVEFLVGHIGLGFIGVASAELYRQVGIWGVILVIIPLALARQSFARALDLQRAQDDLSQAYAAERRRVEELERLDRAKAEVAQVLTHDFLHAIATLRTYVTALRKQWNAMDEEERVEVSGWIEREADRLKALAEQSVAVMFGDTDGPTLSMEPERVADLVAEAADATKRLDGRLRVDVAPDAAATEVRADRVRVLQVFRNLIGNAETYSDPGTPVELGARLAGDEVRFTIRDHGVGIDPAQSELLFRPFSRLPGTMTEGVQGSGLGLYISRQIVEAHAGRIGVDSEPGEGSTFWFTLRKAEAGA
jgi:signal transduction histidine kinase